MTKVLAWGVLCGSGELHFYFGEGAVHDRKSRAEKALREYDQPLVISCGPHSIVPLGVVERAE